FGQASQHAAEQPLRDLRDDGVLAGEVLVERSDVHARAFGDAIGGGRGVAELGEQLAARLHERLEGDAGALLSGKLAGAKFGASHRRTDRGVASATRLVDGAREVELPSGSRMTW